ncbi:hypothetical protein EEB14_53075 [Rhodococcus sp. WS4]|nr:hypothetical protein EEB14_53075 [Rhodococcus sp. WS4]
MDATDLNSSGGYENEEDNYPHADGFGGYRRQAGEYKRPPRPVVLPEGDVEHDASGSEIYGAPLRSELNNDRVLVELVPEPFNIFDHLAVCLDVNGVKVGYMGATFAEYWHPVVKAFNSKGFHVLVSGEAIDAGGENPGLNLYIPDWARWPEIAEDAGYESGFTALWQQLPEHLRERLVDNFGDWEGADERQIRPLAHLMPDAAWERGGLPFQLQTQIRNQSIARYKERDRLRQEEHEKWETERSRLRQEVHSLRIGGMTFTAIGRKLGFSGSKASTMFKEHSRTDTDPT